MDSDFTASTRALRTWRTSLLEGARRFERIFTGGSSISLPLERAEATDRGVDIPEFWEGVFGLSIHGFSLGVAGVVYCERAVRERSQRFGTHTPTRTRQAATSRLPLVGEYDEG